MNRIYQSIWNQKIGTFVAVSEFAKRGGRKIASGSGSISASGVRFALNPLIASMLLAVTGNAWALPVGGEVSAGSVSIGGDATAMEITQSSQNAAINWQAFDVATGEAVNFAQPNSSAVTLNRVLGSDPSAIMGTLTANGRVFLVNPNGVLFGQNASVNVGGLVASTLAISDSDFMAGRYDFAGTGDGRIVNQGTLNADGGHIALLGANVSNQGTLQANLGTVALAAGDAITLDVAGDGLLNVAVSEGALDALVQNGGMIQADGGKVLMTAESAGELFQSTVNNTGAIRAQSIENRNGTIMLMGDMQSGTVKVGGTLDASANNGGDGGFIETSAAHVKIANDVQITTAAPLGKTGTWLIDPVDFVISSTGDISGSTLSAQLVNTSVRIENVPGAGNGDIFVNEAVTWTPTPSPTTLTLNASRDVIVNEAITTTGGNLQMFAERDVNVYAALEFTDGDVTAIAGQNVNMAAATTVTRGDLTAIAGQDVTLDLASDENVTVTEGNITLIADNDGTGPGADAGTVDINCVGNCITLTDGTGTKFFVVRFNPENYGTTDAEILAYDDHLTGTGAANLDIKAWGFGLGDDKVYDGTRVATVSGFEPDLDGGLPETTDTLAASNALFDTKDVGVEKPITYETSFEDPVYALFTPYETTPGTYFTRADITPAPLTITADDGTKVYGETFPLSRDAFTSDGLVNAETVSDVTLTSPGTVATSSVDGSPYAITPADATGGTFDPGNYEISYVNGALTVTPAPLLITADDDSKTFGETLTLSPTAFTSDGLVNGDTVGSVTLNSDGTVAKASVDGSPYPIEASDADGGTFVSSNYDIAYADGTLVVNAAPVDPDPVDPDPVDPDPVDPDEPTPTDPEPTEPVDPDEPTPTDPSPTDPEDPTPTDPTPTDPTPTDPSPTDPTPTDPVPTEPAEPTPDEPDVATPEEPSSPLLAAFPEEAIRPDTSALDENGMLFVSPPVDSSEGLELTFATAAITVPALQLERLGPQLESDLETPRDAYVAPVYEPKQDRF
ncbi:MAG: filamentous hemagglutinin N-terminal domain-containing protein [Pseudomonadota bacterium]